MTGAVAEIVFEGFLAFDEAFRAVTRRAPRRFAARDWPAARGDALERLQLYRRAVDGALDELARQLGRPSREGWEAAGLKERYAALAAGRNDPELAATFFNSVVRRLFQTRGVDPALEFLGSDLDCVPGPRLFGYERYACGGLVTGDFLAGLLRRTPIVAPWAHLESDAEAVARRVALTSCRAWPGGVLAVDVVPAVFYRGKGAYVVARLCGRGDRQLPLVVALLNERDGVRVDAALFDEASASIAFGFTRSYFFVDTACPGPLVGFLKSIMPGKPVAELYTSLGHNRHGKTELYRELVRHMDDTEERFELAPGTRGMVMAVFALPSFDHVFKVIRDRFPEPKDITRTGVMEKYELVFRHGRAGRLVDAQEFEHLRLPRSRFSARALDELLGSAAGSVTVRRDEVGIAHVYVERRLKPLDLYLKEASPGEARAAVIDYGQAIRDLAATDVFPGDVLLKNFGVTRHGRVVFYDYDELSRLTECRFRRLPVPRDDTEAWAAEPWFYVGPRDVFPEEFASFLGLRPALLAAFREAHAELLTAEYWQNMQARIEAGEIVDIFPYRPEQRLQAAENR
ncbi:MAG TPA: bifunctional isocitrate dehydrogenase kinase/phosphatase [Vicinamibacteria bacterium]|nr:bifunctional isocitrate dehydrogenase kinase/phosphatase [Vicinamibacteria bacterium]